MTAANPMTLTAYEKRRQSVAEQHKPLPTGYLVHDGKRFVPAAVRYREAVDQFCSRSASALAELAERLVTIATAKDDQGRYLSRDGDAIRACSELLSRILGTPAPAAVAPAEDTRVHALDGMSPEAMLRAVLPKSLSVPEIETIASIIASAQQRSAPMDVAAVSVTSEPAQPPSGDPGGSVQNAESVSGVP